MCECNKKKAVDKSVGKNASEFKKGSDKQFTLWEEKKDFKDLFCGLATLVCRKKGKKETR